MKTINIDKKMFSFEKTCSKFVKESKQILIKFGNEIGIDFSNPECTQKPPFLIIAKKRRYNFSFPVPHDKVHGIVIGCCTNGTFNLLLKENGKRTIKENITGEELQGYTENIKKIFGVQKNNAKAVP